MKKQPNDFIGVNTYLSVQARGLVKRVVSADGSSPSVILNDVSLDIPGAGLTAIVGPSGAGKTSLLYVLSGLDRPDSGRVVIGGTDIYALDEERRSRFIRGHIGFVFQQYNLVPYLTVEENVMLPLSLAHRKADYIRVTQLLSRFGLRRRARTVVSALSGGEQQRVALCRPCSCARRWCSPTSPPARSTPRTASSCCRCCASWRIRVPTWSWSRMTRTPPPWPTAWSSCVTAESPTSRAD